VSALGASSVATDGWFSAADAAASPSEELANISVEQLKIQLLQLGPADDHLVLRAIDVYRIPQGCTKKDAFNNRKGDTYSRYQPGGPDVVIHMVVL
jgi:hypothetical protein